MPFSLRHIPALFQASTTTFGGIWPLFNARGAILEFGFPERVAGEPATHPIMAIGMARTTVLGLLLFLFYFRGQYREVDTLMAVMGFYVGIVDSWFVWKETGLLGWPAFRLVASWFFGAWGLAGMTASS
ncbi:hypothetical protein V8F33_010120 [Rhypophila sp. PSN 637]